MKYYVEDSLSNFKFWSGGKDRADLLTDEQFDIVESMLEECEPEEGWSDTDINNFFWFDFDTICGWLGYADEEHLEAGVSNQEIKEAQEWAEDTSTDYNALFAIAEMNPEKYAEMEENDEDSLDCATEDFMNWWNSMSDIEQVREYRKYQ